VAGNANVVVVIDGAVDVSATIVVDFVDPRS
jgi:hypothetical protein